jgi:hypothetical protein
MLPRARKRRVSRTALVRPLTRDHAIGLGMARQDEAAHAVLDPVAAVLAGRFTFAGGATAIGEGLAVIRPGRGDLNGCGLKAVGQEALGAGGGFFGQALDINPARGAVDGGEAVGTLVLIRHWRQERNIDRDDAGGISFEGLIGRLAARITGQEGAEVRDLIPWRRRQGSKPKREIPSFRNSQVTAKRSSRGSSKDWRRATTTAS